MAVKSKRDLVVEKMMRQSGESPMQYRNLQLAIYAPDGADPLIRVGGRWDTLNDCWSGDATHEVKLDVQYQQVPAAADVADWLSKYVRILVYAREHRCTLDVATAAVWGDEPPWYRLLLIGGRRGGKTYYAVLLIVLIAITIPDAFLVIISPTRKHTTEIHKKLTEFLPVEAREWRASEHVYALVNGSRILLHTGGARSLKLGETTAVMINEGQLTPRSAYIELEGNVIDAGGFVVIAANPPDRKKGMWVEYLHNDITNGKVGGRTYSLSGRKNPHISQLRLMATAEGMTDVEVRRELDGELGIPVGDIVIEGFSTTANVLVHAVPRSWIDVTREVSERYFGHTGIERVGGLDFDKGAGCAYSTGKFYLPIDRFPRATVADAVLVLDYAHRLIDRDENYLTVHLGEVVDRYGQPLFADQDSILWVADASGGWQSSERRHHDPTDLPSWQRVRRAGWRNLVKPDPELQKNPRVKGRFALARALVRPRWNGHPRVFMLAPTANEAIEATASYPLEKGVPMRKSSHAHIVDTWTYLVYRRWAIDVDVGALAGAMPEFVTDSWSGH